MVFETALILSVVSPMDMLKFAGLGLGSLLFIFLNWNEKSGFEPFFSIEGWKNLFKARLELIGGNEKIFKALCRTISESRQTLEQQAYQKMSGGLKDAFDVLNHEMASMESILLQLENHLVKKSQ